jgi:hypothetical protein
MGAAPAFVSGFVHFELGCIPWGTYSNMAVNLDRLEISSITHVEFLNSAASLVCKIPRVLDFESQLIASTR